MAGPHRLAIGFVLALSASGAASCVGELDGPPVLRGIDTTPPGDRSTTGIPRLSRREIEASVRDVLGIEGAATRNLPADPPLAVDPATGAEGEVFDTLVDTKEPNQVFVEGLESMAFEIGRDFAEDTAAVDALAGCTPSGFDETCLRQLASNLGLRLWRRPLETAELDALMTSARAFEGDGHYVAVRLVAMALIESPELVYRTELGTEVAPGVVRLTNHEVIARMAYVLWGSTPSPALLARASGAPFGDEEIASIASEMLEDPRADAQMRTFHRLWLRYPSSAVADATLHADMQAESEALVDRALEDDAAWSALFDARETFVTPALATHYGLASPASAGWVPYDGDRAGILAHGSFLSLSATRVSETLPSRRGAMLARRILCETILPPPPDVDVDDGVEVPEGACKSEAYEAHRSVGACYGCHTTIDGLGFGFERFDGLGRYREVEESNTSCTIDGAGSYGGATFTGPRGLVEVAEEAMIDCGIEHLVRFAYRDRALADDRALLRRLEQDFEGSGLVFRELLRAIVTDPSFAHRIASPDVGLAPWETP
ncbi:MAG: DUF1588 domain-containing protein [Deltaproteobacteria bacterium]|nr:DUF1588 domain-containing protein [Deltaproteobacteria bacterium]